MRLVSLLPFAGVAAVGLSGCFSPEPPAFDVTTLTFENDYTESDDIVIQPYQYDNLSCPDGQPATFYTVYREGLTEAAPIVIFFHSGAFDFLTDPNPDDPLHGASYQRDLRLGGDWANQKIFETLGLIAGDGTEQNLGTLPAALADAGTFTLYPANCWGDMWHNETGYAVNDPDEGFTRNGRYLAWVMSAIASPDAATAVFWQDQLGLSDLPITLDFSSISLVGLGDGGRAIPELFRRSQTVTASSPSSAALPAIKGILIDSTMDDLSPIVASEAQFPDLYEGLSRMYYTDLANVYSYSLGRWFYERAPGYPVHLAWSSSDPVVPDETLSAYFAMQQAYPSNLTSKDYGTPQHVFLNANIVDSQEAVRVMLGR